MLYYHRYYHKHYHVLAYTLNHSGQIILIHSPELYRAIKGDDSPKINHDFQGSGEQ